MFVCLGRANSHANYLASGLKGLVAFCARKTLLMVCIAHCRNNLALNIMLTHGAFGAEQFLIIDNTVIDSVLGEESASRQ